jgi:hypothetical protein
MTTKTQFAVRRLGAAITMTLVAAASHAATSGYQPTAADSVGAGAPGRRSTSVYTIRALGSANGEATSAPRDAGVILGAGRWTNVSAVPVMIVVSSFKPNGSGCNEFDVVMPNNDKVTLSDDCEDISLGHTLMVQPGETWALTGGYQVRSRVYAYGGAGLTAFQIFGIVPTVISSVQQWIGGDPLPFESCGWPAGTATFRDFETLSDGSTRYSANYSSSWPAADCITGG